MQVEERREDIWEMVDFQQQQQGIIIEVIECEQAVEKSAKKRRNFTKILIICGSIVLVIGGVLMAYGLAVNC